MTKEHVLSQLDEENLMRMYYDDSSFEEMYDATKIPRRKIRDFFKNRKMKLSVRYNFNESFFEKVDSKEKAYWLGYLYCDGFVGEGKYNNIVLSSIDEHVVDKFLVDLEFDKVNKVKVKKLATEKRKANSFAKSTLFEARFSSKTMKQDLSSRNIIPNRKNSIFLKYDDIEPKYLIYLLFGFLDADAYIAYGKNGRKVIHLFSSTELLGNYQILLDELNIRYTIKRNDVKNCYYLRISFSDTETSKMMEDFRDVSLMYRKFTAPSLSKDSVE